MSDWDFLYEMRDEGYSPEEIADAAASGASPQDWEYIAKQEAKMERETANKPSRKVRSIRTKISKCRVVFFDLEFYVPPLRHTSCPLD